jgi:hypothetical protein|tara:strand:+ start:3031 stop:3669 length:639 start_codon:yes stop_codon:yes gene_type:complete
MSSVRLLVVEKNGTIKESVLKTWNEEELYKKAGFKNGQGFELATTWKVDDINKKSYTINVYGKTEGRANQENKYEFPPPIDETLFFGSCLIVNMRNDKPVSLTSAEWTCIYEKLYGGFESLGEEDSEEESDEYDDVPKTKSGYAKDEFIVDDDYEDSDESEEFAPPPKKKTTKKTSKKSDKNIVPDNVFMELSNEIDELLDYTKELEKEEYL